MPGRTASYSFDARSQHIIGERQAGRSRSETLHELLRRYDAVMRDSCPELTTHEWEWLATILLGSYLSINGGVIQHLDHEIDDAVEIGEPPCPSERLPKLAREWTLAERVALIDYLDRHALNDPPLSDDARTR